MGARVAGAWSCGGCEGAVCQAGEGLDHQRGADGGEAFEEVGGGLFGGDGDGLGEQHGAGVEARVEAHGGDAGVGFAVGDGPLDGRGAAVLRQQRAVQVDAAEAGQGEHPVRDDAAVGDDEDGVGGDGFELGAEVGVVA